jgi:hypothetical protein
MATMNGMHDNELALTAPKLPEISETIELFKSQGRRSASIFSDASTALADSLAAEFTRHDLPAPIITHSLDIESMTVGRDGLFLAVSDCTELSGLLTRLSRVAGVFVWAPKTRHYFKSRPVFVQSVPKSGTHVVFECLKAFGYAAPPSLDLPQFDAPIEDGVFYNLQHMPMSCLSLPYRQIGRFVDSLSRSVIVFIIRDPRDVAVSLAYYLALQDDYHIIASLFRGMPADERIRRVIVGDYPIPIYLNRYLNLSGSIRELFMPYLSLCGGTFPNVWRVHFEDIIGANGGGDIERQLETIWGLQLALHVPGRPGSYSDSIFSTKSLTYRKGRIGEHLIDFSREHHELFQQSASELLRPLGYTDRWKAARAFSVILPATCESSANVASQLRSEFASHGRNFLSMVVQAAHDDGPAGFGAHFELAATCIGGNAIDDRVLLLIEACNGVRDNTTELVNIDQSRYSLRIRKTCSTRMLINAIVEALVKIGCIDRLLEMSSGGEPNVRFVGEIQAVAHKRKDDVRAGVVRHDASSLTPTLEPRWAETGETDLMERLGALERSLEERTRRLASLEGTIVERSSRLLAMEQALEERNQRIASLEATVEERDTRLLAVEQTLEERNRRIESLEATIDERTRRLEAVEQAAAGQNPEGAQSE